MHVLESFRTLDGRGVSAHLILILSKIYIYAISLAYQLLLARLSVIFIIFKKYLYNGC